jgi:hypothetical protein
MIDEVPLFTRNDGTILKDRAAVHTCGSRRRE